MTFAHTHIVVFAHGCHFTLLYSPFLLRVPFLPLLLCHIYDKHLRITMNFFFLPISVSCSPSSLQYPFYLVRTCVCGHNLDST